jgi:hypothetical protein
VERELRPVDRVRGMVAAMTTDIVQGYHVFLALWLIAYLLGVGSAVVIFRCLPNRSLAAQLAAWMAAIIGIVGYLIY